MKRTTAGLILLSLCCITGGVLADEPRLDNDELKTLYTLGYLISQRLAPLDLNDAEVAAVQAGMVDAATRAAPRTSVSVYTAGIEPLLNAKAAAALERAYTSGRVFRGKAATKPGAITTDTGMIYTEIEPGAGESPGATDTTTLHYHGTLPDGAVFDSSIERGEPATFALSAVIPCFSEGLQRMRVGGKARLICPPEIAYGERGSPPRVRGGETLIFDVELLAIEPDPLAPPAQSPAD
jgi:FKBP-type peptidyl-prolyl cis-trans isomerase